MGDRLAIHRGRIEQWTEGENTTMNFRGKKSGIKMSAINRDPANSQKSKGLKVDVLKSWYVMVELDGIEPTTS